MSRMLTAGSGAITPMNRRNQATGKLFQVTPERDEYAVPPRGTYGRFRLTGISDTFELTSEQYGLSVNVRLEFEIVKVQDAESKYLEGRKFTALYTWTVGPRSNLGGLIGALRGHEIQSGENVNPDEFIDTEFVTTTTMRTSRDGSKEYAGVATEGISRNKTALSKWITAPRQPELVPAGGVEDDLEDPFLTDPDDSP